MQQCPNPSEQETIRSSIARHQAAGDLTFDAVVNDLSDLIAATSTAAVDLSSVKGLWIKKIDQVAKMMNIVMTGRKSIVWPQLETSHPSSSKITSSLKSKLTASDKLFLKNKFETLKHASKDFWILESTKKNAIKTKESAISVEEVLMEFALQCEYYHPSQSLILDLDDPQMAELFTTDELEELQNYGTPLLRDIPEEIRAVFKDFKSLKTPVDIYNYARKMDHDPIEEPLKVWLSTEIPAIAKQFFKRSIFEIESLLESDQLYGPWRFVKTVVDGSEIRAIGKEKSSTANAAARNNKRKLSGTEPIPDKKMGHRMDTIYIGGDRELGCIEIGCKSDQTKEFKDSRLKMPIVLRDMLVDMIETKSMLHKVHTIGYSITGNKISLLDMDVPCGIVTRIRRTEHTRYPSTPEMLRTRLASLLELALIGHITMQETLEVINDTTVPLRSSGASSILFPTVLLGASDSSSAKSSTTSSKKQKS